MNVYCLYFPDGKRYVGIESFTGKRIASHKNTSKCLPRKPTAVAKALFSLGWEKIKWRYLATNCSKKEALFLERFFIAYHKLTEPSNGYNKSPGVSKKRFASNVVELRLFANRSQMEDLLTRTQCATFTEVVSDAITLLDWATQEIGAGRRVVALDGSGNAQVPVMEVLNRVRRM